MGNFLLRGLVSYPWLPADQGGNQPVPDLATDLGQVSADGLTVTFTLKDGVMWQAPLSRPVTSADVAFAFQRINTKSLIAQYGNYYCGTIVGMDCNAKSQTDPIEGITTPDDKTIVFQLERPTGDFLYRLAQPAAAPVPPEVAGCFDKAGDYGRYVMSDGPYMFLGSDQLDVTSCDTLKPVSGYEPEKFMYMVRNPSYDQATDDNRKNYIDGWSYVVNTNTEDIYNRVLSGDIDITNVAEIRQKMMDCVESEEGDVLVNAQELDYIDSTGIGMLVRVRNEVISRGGTVKIVGLKAHMARLFNLTGLSDAFLLED
jgi:peptide/nickel transport system substrate-binding protein